MSAGRTISLPSESLKDCLTGGYEAIRRTAIERRSAGGVGMALLIRQGMVMWMFAWCASQPPSIAPMAISGGGIPALPSGIRSEIVVVLASLALGRYREALA